MTFTVAQRATDLPQLQHSGGRAPLVLFMPTRREQPLAWRALWETYLKSESSVLLVLDKTQGGSATKFFSAQVAAHDSPGTVCVLQRPFDEDIFQSVSDLSIDSSLYVMQFHDDDEWSGVPVLPEDPRGTISFKARCRRDSSPGQAGYEGHLSWFFGAIRGDVWTRFMHLCGTKTVGTNPTVDQTLAFILEALGRVGELGDYQYVYNNDNWATWSHVAENNERAMRHLGWECTDAVPAVHWCQLLDDLEALNAFGDLMSDEEVRQSLAQRLNFPLTPAGLGSLDSAIWRICPPTVRASLVRSRGVGRGQQRLRKFVGALAHSRLSPSERALLGGYGPITLKQVHNEYLPALRDWASPALNDQFAVWTASVAALEIRTQGAS